MLPILFSITHDATGISDKGYLRMIESLLNVKHTALMQLSDPTLFSRLYRGDVLDLSGLCVLTSCEDSVTRHFPGLFTTLKVTFCSSFSFISFQKYFSL